ncbi:hypothetical protein SAMN05216559_2517 [Halomicrobium zhouii]|uniref:Uncharacterized protein n=1 Tax=Halomicrobium zhouii TaxID=767519 RepID=A0A1I6LDQ2_9EURY|nr:hypothetical protein [Halomicrobium zhouii]SFS01573.1 hypothetical protein SAMN05216559_2517 [Halomicrobium zhouii]
MSREFTFFQFDVDEDAIRRILASIPGVEPVQVDERDQAETARPASDAEAGPSTTGGDDASSTGADVGPTGADVGPTGEPSARSAGVEAHLDDTPRESRATASTWTRPSTPWPGAPTDEPDDEDGGTVARMLEKKLLIGGVATALGVVGAVAVWFLKFRDSGGADEFTSDRRGATGQDPTPDDPHADDEDSRDYPVDVAPVVGMAFLAVATVILRRFDADRED